MNIKTKKMNLARLFSMSVLSLSMNAANAGSTDNIDDQQFSYEETDRKGDGGIEALWDILEGKFGDASATFPDMDKFKVVIQSTANETELEGNGGVDALTAIMNGEFGPSDATSADMDKFSIVVQSTANETDLEGDGGIDALVALMNGEFGPSAATSADMDKFSIVTQSTANETDLEGDGGIDALVALMNGKFGLTDATSADMDKFSIVIQSTANETDLEGNGGVDALTAIMNGEFGPSDATSVDMAKFSVVQEPNFDSTALVSPVLSKVKVTTIDEELAVIFVTTDTNASGAVQQSYTLDSYTKSELPSACDVQFVLPTAEDSNENPEQSLVGTWGSVINANSLIVQFISDGDDIQLSLSKYFIVTGDGFLVEAYNSHSDNVDTCEVTYIGETVSDLYKN